MSHAADPGHQQVTVRLPRSVAAALATQAAQDGTSESSVVTTALAHYLDVPIHTLFQMSTSAALVEGVFTGAVSVDTILEHGDFGLGTFAGLEGEMVVLDGVAYQAHDTGEVNPADGSALAPFAVVTRFAPQVDVAIGPTAGLDELLAVCDTHRASGNIFYALRAHGHFERVLVRVVSQPHEGGRLVDAAKEQATFEFVDTTGTLVGIWSPGFSSSFSVPGYHLHFLSDDRTQGGHVLSCSAGPLSLQVETLTKFRLALPETAEFLAADLSKNTDHDLAYAEQAHETPL